VGVERIEVGRVEVAFINVIQPCLIGHARGFTGLQLKPRHVQFNSSNLNTEHLVGLSILALKMSGGKY
jgi:hypothetical protein